MAKNATTTESTSKKKALTGEKASEKKSSKEQKAEEKKSVPTAQHNGKQNHEKNDKQKHKEHAKQEAKLMLKAGLAEKDVQKAQQKLTKAQSRLDEALTEQLMIEQKLMALRGTEQNGATKNGHSTDEPQVIVYSEGVVIFDEVPQEETTTDATNEQSADTSDTTEVPEQAATDAQGAAADEVTEVAEDGDQVKLKADSTSSDASDSTPQMLLSDEPPAEGRNDISDTTEDQNPTPSMDAEQEQVTPTTENTDYQISSGDASMPLLSNDDNTWPPPLIREEVAQAADEVSSSSHQNEEAPSSDQEQQQ